MKTIPLIKYVFALMLILCLAVVPACANEHHMDLFNAAYLTDTLEAEFLEFEITGGLLKDFEGTFDASRTIIGSAPKDTEVSIFVYQYDPDSETSFSLLSETTIIVGSAGIFSSTIDLELGENYVLLTGNKELQQFKKTSLLKHKNPEIKQVLEQSFLLPAQILSGAGK